MRECVDIYKIIEKENMRRAGFEPASTPWQGAILAIRLPSQDHCFLSEILKESGSARTRTEDQRLVRAMS